MTFSNELIFEKIYKPRLETLVARELAPAGLRSRPIFTTAAQPSGSKLPRHKKRSRTQGFSY
ncbi:hypothetical protein B1219_01735 [Pseudomonas ogarae]|nr:hypothetical protein B1219_01735 [Pseudomonas ogarae]